MEGLVWCIFHLYVWLQLLLPDECLLSIRFVLHSEYPVAAQINFGSYLPASFITGILLKTEPLQNVDCKETLKKIKIVVHGLCEQINM